MTNQQTSQVAQALDHIDRYKASRGDQRKTIAKLRRQIIEEGQAVFDRSNMRGHITASVLILNPERTKCLLIDHLHHKMWLPPGGHIEEGPIAENALREAAEETGLDKVSLLWPHPIHIDTHPITARPAKNEGEHFHHDMLFLGVTQSTETTLQKSEIADVKWVELRDLALLNGHAADGARQAIKMLKGIRRK